MPFLKGILQQREGGKNSGFERCLEVALSGLWSRPLILRHCKVRWNFFLDIPFQKGPWRHSEHERIGREIIAMLTLLNVTNTLGEQAFNLFCEIPISSRD
jgi:hypothetical protein